MNTLQLYPHQKDMVADTKKKIAKRFTRILLFGPTGLGKTEVAVSLMTDLAKDYKIYFVVDRLVLIDQTKARLEKYGITAGILQAKRTANLDAQIVIASKQTMQRRGSELLDEHAIMFLDEVHVMAVWLEHMQACHPNVIYIGLSASPLNRDFRKLWDCVVSSPTPNWLTEHGHLAQIKYFAAESQINLASLELNRATKEYTGESIAQAALHLAGDVVESYRKRSIEHFGELRKAILFAATIAQAQNHMQAFIDAGIGAVLIHHKTKPEERKEIFAKIADKDSGIFVLCSVDVVSRGFDLACIYIGISCRPFATSINSLIQQIGRIGRPLEGKVAIWLDHAGNITKFYSKYKHYRQHGIKNLEDLNDVPIEEDLEFEEPCCPECRAVGMKQNWVCMECGYEYPRPVVAEIKELELEEVIFEDEHASRKPEEPRDRVWMDVDDHLVNTPQGRVTVLALLKSVALERNYKIGWASFIYRHLYGEFPPWGQIELVQPLKPSQRFLDWVDVTNAQRQEKQRQERKLEREQLGIM